MSTTEHATPESPTADLAVIEAMSNELENHLVANEVYRTIIIDSDGSGQPHKMSLGELLARLNRLMAERPNLPPETKNRVDNVLAQFETTSHELLSRYHELLVREVRTRLNALRWFLEDCAEDRERCRSEFPFEMRNRQRITEIVKALGDALPAELADEIAEVDARIRNLTHEAEFTWQDKLQIVYPEDAYWYLYVLP